MRALDVTNQLPFTLLLLPLGIVLAIALAFGLLILKHVRRNRGRRDRNDIPARTSHSRTHQTPHRWSLDAPRRWCAVRSSSVQAIQSALGLHNAKACSWGEGMAQLAEHSLLISPPIQGWVLVVGHGLPDPAEDADECFHFLRKLSRTLGHVQFFSVHGAVSHHAWVQLEDGEILRAYAWAGETVWNQGEITRTEDELGLKCFGYGEPISSGRISRSELLQANVEKIHRLAARWSLDPASINDSTVASGRGVVGDLSHSGRH